MMIKILSSVGGVDWTFIDSPEGDTVIGGGCNNDNIVKSHPLETNLAFNCRFFCGFLLHHPVLYVSIKVKTGPPDWNVLHKSILVTQ